MTSEAKPLRVNPVLNHKACRLGLAVSALSLLVPSLAHAQLFITVGNNYVKPNEANQHVQLFVENRGSSPITVSGLNLNVQVADSGPASENGSGSIDGPNITGLDIITGTVLGTVGNSGNNVSLWPTTGIPKQFGTANTQTSLVSLGAHTETLLATVTIDTTGFNTVADNWDLKLGDTGNGPTYYTGTAITDQIIPTFTEGKLTIVPEPATYALGIGGFMLGFALIRRHYKGC